MSYDESTRYVSNRNSLWCPMCGASAGQGCTAVKNSFMLRFASHNAVVNGTVPRSVAIPPSWEAPPVRKDAPNRIRTTTQRWA